MLTKPRFQSACYTTFVVCVMFMLVACKGVVNISTYYEELSSPAKEPVVIYVNGEKAGSTDDTGKTTLTLAPGHYLFNIVFFPIIKKESQCNIKHLPRL